jgi:hypothetical protein
MAESDSAKGIIKIISRNGIRGKKKKTIISVNTFFANITRCCDAYGKKGFNLLATPFFGSEFDILNMRNMSRKDITCENKRLRVIMDWIKKNKLRNRK